MKLLLAALVIAVLTGLAPSAGGETMPEAPALVVTPNTGLVDTQVVTVTGSGFAPDEELFLSECEGGATSVEECDDVYSRRADASGNVSMQFPVRAVVGDHVGFTGVDCRIDVCEIVASSRATLEALAVASLAFDAAGPLVDTMQVMVQPNVALADGQRVEVAVTGFRGSHDVFLAECSTTDGATVDGCNHETAIYLNLTHGDGTTSFPAERTFTDEGGRLVDCTVDACVIMAMDEFLLADEFGNFRIAQLEFAPAAAAPAGVSPTFTG